MPAILSENDLEVKAKVYIESMDGKTALIRHIQDRAPDYLGRCRRSSRVLEAFRLVDRAFFLPKALIERAYEDNPLPIGHGQTCSQPSMVAFMLDLLELGDGLKVLEVGSGSGYAAALTAILCPRGQVTACEIVPELARRMSANLDAWVEGASHSDQKRVQAARDRIHIWEGDGSQGRAQDAPWDRIFFSAGVAETFVPEFDALPFIAQLSSDGIFLFPEMQGSLHRFTKRASSVRHERWEGVSFVPLIKR